uniref:Fucolectin tachylectin-4 pentraxin-1 domain-containing protein n=1 Tax=Cyprinus carpio TaxID=7962 RepID=A0A8C1MC59_CYPCA
IGFLFFLSLYNIYIYIYIYIAATQSSTFMGWFAEKAIDSNRGLQQNTACSSTLNETNPWWRLDHIYRVRVVVTNRKDCCTEQINRNMGTNNPIYSCGGMEGRYVNLIIPGDMNTLSLCEVAVCGEEGECW